MITARHHLARHRRCHLERRKRLSIVFAAEPDVKEGGIADAEISGGAGRTSTAYMPFVYLPPRSFATLEDDTAGAEARRCLY